MDSIVKREVKDHILKASGLNINSVGYNAIDRLFTMNQLSIWFKYELVMDIRRGCNLLGLKVQLKRDIIYIDEDVIKNYYEEVMGKKYPEQKPELTHYDRVKLTKEKGDQ